MRTTRGIKMLSLEACVAVFGVLLAASYCQAAAVNQTGVTSSELDVIASQPKQVSCSAPAPLGKYDSYCEGLQADYFLLAKQRKAPSLTGLTPNVSTFVTSLNDTAANSALQSIHKQISTKLYSFAVRYSGVFFIDTAGEYQFQINSPPGTRLTVNGNTVTFNQGSNSSTPTTGYNFAQAGFIPIELVFFNENSIPSLAVSRQGPGSSSFSVIEGPAIMFNCSSLQNNTGSKPVTTSTQCSGLSAVYYAGWQNASYATATGVATFAVYEQGLNHWSTTTAPSWSGLPSTLKTDFAARYHGQLWLPQPGTYTFKLYATAKAALFVGTDNLLNSTAVNNLAQASQATYTVASAGYVPVGLNFISRKSSQAGVLRLVWKGPNSPAFKVVNPFYHPCSTFVACANSTTAGALPTEVVGAPPAGATVESSTAVAISSLKTYVPNSNVTFTLGFPFLSPEDPNVEDVAYFIREAVANAAGVKLESVWTIPSIDSATGDVVFPMGAYFTSVSSAQRFYNTVNLRPQTIFSANPALSDFYPITVSSPALGTAVAVAAPVQPARPVATLASVTGEGDTIPIPLLPSPTPEASPNATAVATPSAPTPTPAATSPETPATPIAAAPEAATPAPTPPTTPQSTPAPVPTQTASAPAPTATEPAPTATSTVTAQAPVVPEETANPTPTAVAPEATPAAAPSPAPAATQTPVATETATPSAPVPAPVAPQQTPSAAAPSPVTAETPAATSPTTAETPGAAPPTTAQMPGAVSPVSEQTTAAAPAPATASTPSAAVPATGETPAAVPIPAPTNTPAAAAPAVPPTQEPTTPSTGTGSGQPTPAPTAAAPAPAGESPSVPRRPGFGIGPENPASPYSPSSPIGAPHPYSPSNGPAPGPAGAAGAAPASGPAAGPTADTSKTSSAGISPVVAPSASAPSPANSVATAPGPQPTTSTPTTTSPHTASPSPYSLPSTGPAPGAIAPAPGFGAAPEVSRPYPLGAPAPAVAYSPPPVPTPTSTPGLSLPADAFPVYGPPTPPVPSLPRSILENGYYSPVPPSPGSSLPLVSAPSGQIFTYASPDAVATPQTGSGATPSSNNSPLFGRGSSAVPVVYGSPSTTGQSPVVYGSPSAPTGQSPSTYFIPYPDGVGGHMVPYPPNYSPNAAAPGSPTLFGNGYPTVSPSRSNTLPVYYGLPTTCAPGQASCHHGPYTYYAIDGSKSLTPTAEQTLLGIPSPPPPGLYPTAPGASAPAPGRSFALAPAHAFAPGPAPAVSPAAAPAPGALCACDPKDTTPRTVSIQVLSTAYNSTQSDTIKFNAYVTFSHPTKSLNSSQIRVFTRQPSDTSGTVTTPGVVTYLQPVSQNCAFYSLKGYVSESNPFIVNSTDIYIAAGGDILDACGQPFNVTVTQVQQAHRLEGLLYATGVAYSEAAGVLLDSNTLDLALAFTDPVPGLRANMFSVTGPPNMTTTDLEQVDGSDAYYTFSVTVPETYYGSLTVSMDRAGRQYLQSINPAAVAPSKLTINRANPSQQGNLVNTTMTKAHGL